MESFAPKRNVRTFLESTVPSIGPRALQQNALHGKVTARKPVGSVGSYADINSCNSGLQLRSRKQAPISAEKTETHNSWDGGERRTQHFAVSKERRTCYLFDTAEFQRRAEKVRTTVMSHSLDLKALPFPEAAEIWLEQKRMYNRESTLVCYRDYLKRLVTYFTMPLSEIHIGHVMEYQSQMKGRYHPDSVNKDINVLSQIMRKAGIWAPIKEHYHPLPKPDVDPPKVLSDYEETRFFEFASKHEGTWLAYWVASLTNNTTASGKELRMMQLKDVDMNKDFPVFRVPKNMKNPNRPREIPLNERGAEMMRRILARAYKMGATKPEHYVFPFRDRRTKRFDPTRPATQSWLKGQWNKLIDDAMKARIIPFRVKPDNLRHQAITKLLDSGVPIETVRELAGHGVDSVITRTYYHARRERLREAVTRIQPEIKKPSKVVAISKGASNAS